MSVNSDIKEAARKEIIRRKVMAEMERRKAQGQTGDSTLDRDNTPPSIDTQSPVLAQSMPVSSTDVAISPVQPGFDQPSIGATGKPDDSVPWGLSLGLAGAATGESILNTIKRLAMQKTFMGSSIMPEDTRVQEFAQGMRPIQSGAQNLAADAYGLAPYMLPVAGQGLFATEMATQPKAAWEMAKGIPHHLSNIYKARYGDAPAPMAIADILGGGKQGFGTPYGDPQAQEEIRQQPGAHVMSAAIPLSAAAGMFKLGKVGGKFIKGKMESVKPVRRLITGGEEVPVVAKPFEASAKPIRPKGKIKPEPPKQKSGEVTPIEKLGIDKEGTKVFVKEPSGDFLQEFPEYQKGYLAIVERPQGTKSVVSGGRIPVKILTGGNEGGIRYIEPKNIINAESQLRRSGLDRLAESEIPKGEKPSQKALAKDMRVEGQRKAITANKGVARPQFAPDTPPQKNP